MWLLFALEMFGLQVQLLHFQYFVLCGHMRSFFQTEHIHWQTKFILLWFIIENIDFYRTTHWFSNKVQHMQWKMHLEIRILHQKLTCPLLCNFYNLFPSNMNLSNNVLYVTFSFYYKNEQIHFVTMSNTILASVSNIPQYMSLCVLVYFKTDNNAH